MCDLITLIKDQILTFFQCEISSEKAINLTNLLLAFWGSFWIAKSTLLKLDPATIIKLSETYVGGNESLTKNFIDLKIDTVLGFVLICFASVLELLSLIFDYKFGIESLQIWFLVIVWFVMFLIFILSCKKFSSFVNQQVILKDFQQNFTRSYNLIKSICEGIKSKSVTEIKSEKAELTRHYNDLSRQFAKLKVTKQESPLEKIKSFMKIAQMDLDLDVAQSWSEQLNNDEI